MRKVQDSQRELENHYFTFCLMSVPQPKFRLQARTLYLTFPRCDVTKDSVMKNVKNLLGDRIKYVIVCQEHHSDGELHLHMIVQGMEKFDIKTANYLDPIVGKHGNYQVPFILYPVKRINVK